MRTCDETCTCGKHLPPPVSNEYCFANARPLSTDDFKAMAGILGFDNGFDLERFAIIEQARADGRKAVSELISELIHNA